MRKPEPAKSAHRMSTRIRKRHPDLGQSILLGGGAVLSSTSRLLWRMLGTIKSRTDNHKEKKTKIERPEVSLALPARRSGLNSNGVVQLQQPTEITIAAIFYNEAEYLKEWIEFHLMVGVDRFLLYDNGSTDGFRSVLETYIHRGQIILMPWASFLEDTSAQRLAYAHAVCNCPSTVRWLVFIDVDEFLFSEVSDDIKTILADLENFTALRIPRFEFGPNGHKDKPLGLVIENYTRVSRREFNLKYAWKSAVQPNNVTSIGVHEALVSGETLTFQPTDSRPLELRINHYFSKSESEFENKLRRWYSWKTGQRSRNRVLAKKNALLKAIVESDGGEYPMSKLVERLKAKI